jgi:hypothetical protein
MYPDDDTILLKILEVDDLGPCSSSTFYEGLISYTSNAT